MGRKGFPFQLSMERAIAAHPIVNTTDKKMPKQRDVRLKPKTPIVKGEAPSACPPTIGVLMDSWVRYNPAFNP